MIYDLYHIYVEDWAGLIHFARERSCKPKYLSDSFDSNKNYILEQKQILTFFSLNEERVKNCMNHAKCLEFAYLPIILHFTLT